MILVDTHALLWWQAGGERLSPVARRLLDTDDVLVSPVTFWEIAMLEAKGRLELDRELTVWVGDLIVADQVRIAPLTPTAAVAAGRLPGDGFEGDPADAMVCATARELTVPVLTKDRRIHEFAGVSTGLRAVW